MNKILQKCLDELNQNPHKIEKVIGMLETLIEMNGGDATTIYNTPNMTIREVTKHNPVINNVDEAIDDLANSYVSNPGKLGHIN